MDSWRCIAVCVGQALLYQQFGDLFAVARRFRAFAEHQAFGHSQTAEAASFQRALFTPGADEFLGPPHALAAQMRLHASRRVPPKPYAQTRVCRTIIYLVIYFKLFINIRLLILGPYSVRTAAYSQLAKESRRMIM